MKEYFYAKISEKFGPFSLEELRYENITPQTLIWFEGLPSWQYAVDIEEIQPIFHPEEQEETEQLDIVEQVGSEEQVTLETPVIEQRSTSSITYSERTFNKDSLQSSIIDNYGMYKRLISFKGRIRRLEWWVTIILMNIVNGIFVGVLESSNNEPLKFVLILIYLFAFWVFIAQAAKRCHDRGNSGFIMLFPLYWLWMAFGDSDVGPNEYGTNPKGRNF
jgi:uncharacterized membrane protein YhaH (DUF805 family)